MLLLLGVLCYFCWRGYSLLFQGSWNIIDPNRALVLIRKSLKITSTRDQNPCDIPLHWLFNGDPYNGLLVIIPTYLGSFSSPIYPKQPGVSIVSNSHCSIPKSGNFDEDLTVTLPLRGCNLLASRGCPKRSRKKWLHPRSLTNSSPLKNDAWKTILSFWVPVFVQRQTVELPGGRN